MKAAKIGVALLLVLVMLGSVVSPATAAKQDKNSIQRTDQKDLE